jgi:hypothetical protein
MVVCHWQLSPTMVWESRSTLASNTLCVLKESSVSKNSHTTPNWLFIVDVTGCKSAARISTGR